MAQLNFHVNFAGMMTNQSWEASNGTLSFVPFTPSDSISIGTLNFYVSRSSGSKTLSIGLYSLTGSSLSLANSWSLNTSNTQGPYVSLTATSAGQNITPGNWWLGILYSSGTDQSRFAFYGQSTINPGNAFPGGFIGGRMTASTAALPASIATSDLDITGSDAMMIHIIILTA